MITVFIKVKSAYGVERVYPDCEITEIFASIAKTTTLSDNDLRAIEKLGYVIKMRPRLQFALHVNDRIITAED
jgi:hypothetical protein